MMVKKFFIIQSFLLIFMFANGQKLFFGTYDKNDKHSGVIFYVNEGNRELEKVVELISENNGNLLYNSFTEVDSNLFLGIMYSGGSKNTGSIIKIDAGIKKLEVIYEFDTTTGILPLGQLFQINSDELLGLASSGGVSGNGVIFKFNYKIRKYTVLYQFGNDLVLGRMPCERITYDDSGGILYGVARGGGLYGNGVLYSFDVNKLRYKKHHDFLFPGWAISPPSGSLIFTKNGSLIGSFEKGGKYNRGFIFSYKLTDSFYSVMRDLDSLTGSPIGIPYSNDSLIYTYLLTDSNGYSRNNIGSLEIFSGNFHWKQVPPSTAILSPTHTLAQFSPLNDSTFLCFGNGGGLYKGGVIYFFNTKKYTFNSQYSFSSSTGYSPTTVMPTKFTKGYFATNTRGGSNGSGTFVQFDSAFNLKTIFSFNASPLGKITGNKVIEAKGKKLYVLNREGGFKNKGVILEIQYPILSYRPAYNFGGLITSGDTVPNLPNTYSLARFSDTILAFTTSSGGFHYGGAVCLYSTSSNSILQYYSFKLDANRKPNGKLTCHNGKIYGWLGNYIDQFYANSLFEYNPKTNNTTEIVKLDTLSVPFLCNGSEIAIKNNKIYILLTTFYNQPNETVAILEYDIISKTSSLFQAPTFNGGYNPYGGLTFTGNGQLAFLTYSDNSFNFGKLGLFDIQTKKFEWHNIQGGSDGSNPVGTPLYVQGEHALYFFCSQSGAYNKGSLLRFDLQTKTFQKTADLGKESYYSSMEKISKDVTFIDEFPLSNNQSTRLASSGSLPVYPNPANNLVTVDLPETSSGYLEIYDISGTLKQSLEFSDTYLITFPVKDLLPGCYIIKCFYNDNFGSTKLFIAK